jgi:uncharacterized delta-60 repeat protein
VRPDGKIIIGGAFTSYNGTPRSCIAQLNPDGSLDTTFDPGTGATAGSNYGAVGTVALLDDGKVLTGGQFTAYNGILRNHIARLHADGSLDTTFDPGGGAAAGINYTTVRIIRNLPDGKILVGGQFTSFSGMPRNCIARLHADGAVDATFEPGAGIAFTNGTPFIEALAVGLDGKILVGGDFNSVDGLWYNNVARLNPNGSVDQSLNEGYGTNSTVDVLLARPDGTTLAGGWFTRYNWTGRQYLALIDTEASLLPMFEPFGTGANKSIYTTSLQPDGKVIIGGSFTGFNGTARNYISRLHDDGSVDDAFQPGGNLIGGILTSTLQPDGKLLIGGYFNITVGTTKFNLARLNSDGSPDASFNATGMGPSEMVRAIALQPDGKILIGGSFTSYNGIARWGIARLHPDGSLDTSFDPGTGATQPIVRAIAVQPDGKIILGGDFTTFSGTTRNRIARLEPNGNLDPSFGAGSGFDHPWGLCSVHDLLLQPDGKLLVAGDFAHYANNGHKGITRLLPSGGPDPDFDPGLGTEQTSGEDIGSIRSMALQPDGKILIGGTFRRYDGDWDVSRFARLNPDGSLDNSFNTGTGTATTEDPDQTLDYATVRSITLQPDGHILIAGDFTSYNGTGRNRIARVIGDTDTGVDDGLGTSAILHAYPNPTTDMLTVELPPAAQPRMLTIHDATGRLVQQPVVPAGVDRYAVPVNELAPGMYGLRLSGEGGVATGKFIKAEY